VTRLSVVVPALNEADGIAGTLRSLRALRARGHEVLVVDGGSMDGTPAVAAPLAERVLTAPRGRARQQNAGAAAASGDVLLFLHADTRLPPDADRRVLEGLRRSGRGWGRFDVRLSGRHPLLRLTGWLIALRSRLTGIATGDQAIFVRREWFQRAGGFPDIPLMEDVALTRSLRRMGPPLCLRARVVTSSRRWEARGIVRTILLMWRLRIAYALGADPHRLAERYR
jgi:rSAM/selenodomain-associated transferase 2